MMKGGKAVMGFWIVLIFLGAGYVAIGILTSSLTENQIVAFITSFVIIFALSLVDKMLLLVPESMTSFFEYLSAEYHFNNIARGVIDTRDLIYFASLTGTFLFLTHRAVESARWR